MSAAPITGSLTTAYTTAATGISTSFIPQVAISVAVTGTPINFNVTLDTLTGPFVATVPMSLFTLGITAISIESISSILERPHSSS